MRDALHVAHLVRGIATARHNGALHSTCGWLLPDLVQDRVLAAGAGRQRLPRALLNTGQRSLRQLGFTHHSCVHTPCPASSRCSSCRHRRPRQHCAVTQGTRQILHGSHETPAAVPCACGGSATSARECSIARRPRQHVDTGQAHRRLAAGRVCMHVAGKGASGWLLTVACPWSSRRCRR